MEYRKESYKTPQVRIDKNPAIFEQKKKSIEFETILFFE